MKTLEKAVLDLGFDSVQEFNRMVAYVDISSPAKMQAFRHWQDEDGTKAGLAKLPTRSPSG